MVGTAKPQAPWRCAWPTARRAIRFDRSRTHTVYDMAWTARASASSSSDGSLQVVTGAASSVAIVAALRGRAARSSSGVQGHEVEVHRVDGLRVTPHWTRGDTLELELALTHVAPAGVSRGATAGARASRDVDFHSTVQASFDGGGSAWPTWARGATRLQDPGELALAYRCARFRLGREACHCGGAINVVVRDIRH